MKELILISWRTELYQEQIKWYNKSMKILTLLFIGFTQFLFASDLTQITIGKQNFSIVTETYDIYNSKGEVMKLYKEDSNGKLTYILGLTLKENTGTCSIVKIQQGAYEINGTDIMLYSLWDKRGRIDDAPYGARITHYKMLEDHAVVKKSSYIYIESSSKGYNEDSGMKYLFTPPQTDHEKEELQAYIEEVEQKYEGTFVFDSEARDLITEVKEALQRKMNRRWKRK